MVNTPGFIRLFGLSQLQLRLPVAPPSQSHGVAVIEIIVELMVYNNIPGFTSFIGEIANNLRFPWLRQSSHMVRR
jgi:hypothetical protein